MAFVYSLVRKGPRRDAGASQADADAVQRLNKGHPEGWRFSAGWCVAASGVMRPMPGIARRTVPAIRLDNRQ
jgi:hypothetical protein